MAQLLDNAVNQFSRLPGIGCKTALRLVLHMLRQEPEDVKAFTDALTILRRDVRYCRVCYNISDTDICPICADKRRDASVICVVENIQDVLAIEQTQQYHGLYHVLGGIISPMDGIGPSDIRIDELVERVQGSKACHQRDITTSQPESDATSQPESDATSQPESAATSQPIKEVIFALASTMEGDTTNFYISRRLAQFPELKLSVIARGISVGDELQYTDEVTLGRSIINRVPMNK